MKRTYRLISVFQSAPCSHLSRHSLGYFLRLQILGDLRYETWPRRLMRENKVVLTLKYNQACVADSARQHQTMLEWHSSIRTAVQHEGRNGDSRQQLGDVDVPEDVQQAYRPRRNMPSSTPESGCRCASTNR